VNEKLGNNDKIITQLRDENHQLCEENAILRKKVDALIRMHFGSKSEKLTPEQLDLFIDSEEANTPASADSEDEVFIQATLKSSLSTTGATPNSHIKLF